ncbi:MAG: hypothetical protein RM049_27770 [Nostoc sp. DedQUE04]|uniref:hypothetical protein n=1 Tax=Nostoc sp. DedQUE04 TaxID=3075390 RepID=UPI002AD1D7BF|nr:hypothetical protein [Nostoc sp. DedQUE04]MDZ8139034.1 hypothetical protein [Nostoc sp. DedQUE04]
MLRRYTSFFRFLLPIILFLNLTFVGLIVFSYGLKSNDANVDIHEISQTELIESFLPVITAIVSIGIGFLAGRTEAKAKKDKISQSEKIEFRQEDLQNENDILIRKLAELYITSDSRISLTINRIMNLLEKIEISTNENSQDLIKKAEIAEELVKSINKDKNLKRDIQNIIRFMGVDNFLKRINNPIVKIAFTDESTLRQILNNKNQGD